MNVYKHIFKKFRRHIVNYRERYKGSEEIIMLFKQTDALKVVDEFERLHTSIIGVIIWQFKDNNCIEVDRSDWVNLEGGEESFKKTIKLARILIMNELTGDDDFVSFVLSGIFLPSQITKIAWQAGNGEFGWKKNDIPFVLKELGKLGIAVSHGEVWLIQDDGTWTGLIPFKKEEIIDGKSYEGSIYHWEVDAKENETWSEYVDRSMKEALNAVKDLNPESRSEEKVRDRIRYNLHLQTR